MSWRERRRAAAFKAALMHLSDQQRAVFDAVAIEGASYTETAERLSISGGEVEHQLAAALVALDEALVTQQPQGFWQRLAHRFVPGPDG